MRTFLPTFVFAAVVFIVIFLSYREYKKKGEEENQKGIKGRVVQRLKEEDIQEIKVTGVNSFHLKKENYNWMLMSPIQDLANSKKVEDYLEKVFKKKVQTLLQKKEESKVPWNQYGLKSPERVLFFSKSIIKDPSGKDSSKDDSSKDFDDSKRIKTTDVKEDKKNGKVKDKKSTDIAFSEEFKSSTQIALSSTKSYDNKFFLRIDNKEELYIADGDWDDVIAFESETFREKKVFTENWTPKILFFQHKRKKFKFEKDAKEDYWIYGKNPSVRIDSSFLNSFVKKVEDIKAEFFLSEPIQSKELRKFNLHKPLWVIEFYSSMKKKKNKKENLDKNKKNEIGEVLKGKTSQDEVQKKWTLKVSESKSNNFYIQLSHRNFIGKISNNTTKTWPVKLSDFRDKSYPFSFSTDSVSTVYIRSQKKRFKLSKALKKEGLKKENEEKGDKGKTESKEKEIKIWEIAEGGKPNEEVDEDQLNSFLRQLSRLKAYEFLGLRSQALSTKNQILIKDESGGTLLDLRWNKSFSQKTTSQKKETFYYVRTNKVRDTLALKSSALDDIIDIDLKKEKILPKEEPKKEISQESQEKAPKDLKPKDLKRNKKSKEKAQKIEEVKKVKEKNKQKAS